MIAGNWKFTVSKELNFESSIKLITKKRLHWFTLELSEKFQWLIKLKYSLFQNQNSGEDLETYTKLPSP